METFQRSEGCSRKYKKLIETPITRAFQSISIALDKLNKSLEKWMLQMQGK